MNILLYCGIFMSKVVELTLSTMKIIVITNGKKLLGAILQGIAALVWICVTGVVVVDVLNDPFKIVAYVLGSAAGSCFGSFIEEKVAIGSNMLTVIIDYGLKDAIVATLREKGFAVTVIPAEGKDKERAVLMIMVSRKNRYEIVNIIKQIDADSMIISERASTINGGYIFKP